MAGPSLGWYDVVVANGRGKSAFCTTMLVTVLSFPAFVRADEPPQVAGAATSDALPARPATDRGQSVEGTTEQRAARERRDPAGDVPMSFVSRVRGFLGTERADSEP